MTMQPFLRMFLKPSLETTEENQLDAFTPCIHNKQGHPFNPPLYLLSWFQSTLSKNYSHP